MIRTSEFLFDESIYSALFKNIDELTKEILVISPWMDGDGELISRILEKINGNQITACFITRFYRKRALKHKEVIFKLHDRGARIYMNKFVHAKMFIFDGQILILCSSNLMGTSLFRNHEVGILSRESTLIKDALLYFDWLKQKSRLFLPKHAKYPIKRPNISNYRRNFVVQ